MEATTGSKILNTSKIKEVNYISLLPCSNTVKGEIFTGWKFHIKPNVLVNLGLIFNCRAKITMEKSSQLTFLAHAENKI